MSVEQWSNSVFHFPASPIRSSGIVGRCGRKQSAGLENGNYKTTVSYRHAAPPELGNSLQPVVGWPEPLFGILFDFLQLGFGPGLFALGGDVADSFDSCGIDGAEGMGPFVADISEDVGDLIIVQDSK